MEQQSLPKFHHGNAVDIDLDDWEPSALTRIGAQLGFVLVLILGVWIYHWVTNAFKTNPHGEDSNVHPDDLRTYEGYRNWDKKEQVKECEPVFPGNPSRFYLAVDVPQLTLDRINKEFNATSAKKYITIGGQVFDVTSGLHGVPNCEGSVKMDDLYGKDISLAASLSDYTEANINRPLDLKKVTPEQRKAFFAAYTHIYAKYPIAAVLQGGEVYTPFLKNSSKFDKPNFFW